MRTGISVGPSYAPCSPPFCIAGYMISNAVAAGSEECASYSFVNTGSLSGHDAVALVMSGGGSGGAFSVQVFANTGSWGVLELGEVKPMLSNGGGDRMGAFFGNGRLYIDNPLYLPGEFHAGSTHRAIQRFRLSSHGYDKPALVRDGIAVVKTLQFPQRSRCQPGSVSVSWSNKMKRLEEGAAYKTSVIFNGSPSPSRSEQVFGEL